MQHRSSHPLRFLLIIFFISIFTTGCGRRADSDIAADINRVLKEAGENRGEIEKVLDRYTEPGDSLKLEAARYLVANMAGHSYVTYYLHDSSKVEVTFDVLDYPDYNTLLAGFEKLENERGTLDFDRLEIFEDMENIEAELLIGHIEAAFDVWRGKPWARWLSFENFCEYVLPYRGSNEPLEAWRETFRERYAYIDTLMADSTDPIEAVRLINEDIRSWFKFDPRYYYHPTDQGLAEMFENKMGRCEDMTNLTIYALRANGIAVTSDYTPYWADAGNNHAWNAIVTPDGRALPFMGAEADPGQYNLANKIAKAYRKTFAQQPDNLIFQERKQEEVPPWLAGKSYLDVTADYTHVADINVTLDKDVPDSVDIAYVCVFNSGEWKAIDWARLETHEGKTVAHFKNIGTNVMYLPALYLNKEIVPYASPFVLYGQDSHCRFKADTSRTISLQLTSTRKIKKDSSSDTSGKTHLKSREEYELFYWDDDWRSLGKAVASDKPLTYDNIPAAGLYWLTTPSTEDDDRIFTTEYAQPVWW